MSAWPVWMGAGSFFPGRWHDPVWKAPVLFGSPVDRLVGDQCSRPVGVPVPRLLVSWGNSPLAGSRSRPGSNRESTGVFGVLSCAVLGTSQLPLVSTHGSLQVYDFQDDG